MTIDNPWFDTYKDQIYPKELTLNKSNKFDNETPSLDLNIKLSNGSIETSVMINGRILTSKLLIFLGWTVMYPDFHLTGFTFLSLCDLLELVQM